MTAAIPARLVLEHSANISAMLLGGLRSVLPVKLPASDKPITASLPSPSAELIEAFNVWTGATHPHFDVVPPALIISKVALSVVSKLTARAPYPLLGVLNQGLRLQLHKPLPAGETIRLTGNLIDASDDGYRARIHSRVEIGTASAPNAVTIDAMAAVVLKKRPDGSTSGDRTEPDYQTIGHWQADGHEGVRFFLLTGDFNPIHTLPAVARRTRFKGCIMHGYGAFSQIFEAIQKTGINITDIEIRFIRPLPLPSPALLIQAAETPDADGYRAVRLIDEAGQLYQVGRFTGTEA